jgi:hypothetical protein
MSSKTMQIHIWGHCKSKMPSSNLQERIRRRWEVRNWCISSSGFEELNNVKHCFLGYLPSMRVRFMVPVHIIMWSIHWVNSYRFQTGLSGCAVRKVHKHVRARNWSGRRALGTIKIGAPTHAGRPRENGYGGNLDSHTNFSNGCWFNAYLTIDKSW